MGAGDDMGALRDIAAVRAIQVDVARQKFDAAHARWTGASEDVVDTSDACEAAAQNWVGLLRSASPDPVLMSISGKWLVDQEAELRTAYLREGIMHRERDRAASLLALRQAELETANEIGRRIRKAIGRNREETQARELADHHLRRRPQ